MILFGEFRSNIGTSLYSSIQAHHSGFSNSVIAKYMFIIRTEKMLIERFNIALIGSSIQAFEYLQSRLVKTDGLQFSLTTQMEKLTSNNLICVW